MNKLKLLGLALLVLNGCSSTKDLPNYIVAKEGVITPQILKQKAGNVPLPLKEADFKDIKTLEAKFDQEENCAGLAAPQIGIAKKIIVFSAPDDEELKKYRKDFTQTMEKTIWVNASYENIGNDKHEDVEGCFSVKDRCGFVKRYKKIKYKAFDISKNKWVEGVAEGFLARIIQHEIDHINGILCIDVATTVFNIEDYKKKLKKASNS